MIQRDVLHLLQKCVEHWPYGRVTSCFRYDIIYITHGKKKGFMLFKSICIVIHTAVCSRCMQRLDTGLIPQDKWYHSGGCRHTWWRTALSQKQFSSWM